MNYNILEDNWEDMNLDYEGQNKFASFFSSEGNIHSYPAKALPEMINSLLLKLVGIYDIKTVMDPFVGSGTVALEAKYLGLDFYGSDLNPLAILLARTKVLTINNTPYIKKKITEFAEDIIKKYKLYNLIEVENFKNIDYWFKENNIRELSFIKKEINKILKSSKGYRETYALILLTAFSSTIRSSSLTRNGEFKLYRMSTNDIEKFNVDATLVFKDKISNLLNMLVVANDSYRNETECKIYLENAKNLTYMEGKKVELIITSPPYGDSQTTVAYGQFSKLSIQWMSDLMQRYLNIGCNCENCDEYLLGGKKSEKELEELKYFNTSKTLNELILEMDRVIEFDINQNKTIRDKLKKFIENLDSDNYLNQSDLVADDIIYKLIQERIRLDIYRKINSKKSKLSNKDIKKLAKKQTTIYLEELFSENEKIKKRRQKDLKDKLPYVMETMNRKIQSLPNRKDEVIDFFKDLYKVTIETNKVLVDKGIQAWIVGHRTVLGSISVNMEGILREWFEAMDYTVVTSLQRKYSFKRMPHHINSTILRNNEVQTMMNEYILIVQKNNRIIE